MNDYRARIYDSARNAYEWAKHADSRMIYPYACFYDEGCKNPCLARIIFNDVVDKGMKKNKLEATAAGVNIARAEKLKPIKDALHNYAEAFRTLYPKSEWIRRFSLDTRRVVLDEVKGKAGWFHKFKVGQFMKRYEIKTFFKG